MWRLADGTRRLVSMQEITGFEGDVITMQEIFTLHRDGTSNGGRINGQLVATGIRPNFADKLKLANIELASEIFEPTGRRLH